MDKGKEPLPPSMKLTWTEAMDYMQESVSRIALVEEETGTLLLRTGEWHDYVEGEEVSLVVAQQMLAKRKASALTEEEVKQVADMERLLEAVKVLASLRNSMK